MKLRGLYAITPAMTDTRALCDGVEAALSGGASAIQYRHKGAAPELALVQARRLLAICRRHGRPLLINDSVALMLEAGADGVHLGHHDEAPALVRARLGALPLIGVSCYGDIALAQRLRHVADYFAFGAVAPSQVKPRAALISLALFEQTLLAGLPTVASGGIDVHNVAAVVAAGATAVGVISALFGAADVEAAARALSAAFEGTSDRPVNPKV